MRVLLKVRIPAGKGSAALRDGSMQRTVEEFMNAVKPEAAFFAPMCAVAHSPTLHSCRY